jgi:DMSO/TMAO reductase YedYZ molybdopterin-dependent catalytic subunit
VTSFDTIRWRKSSASGPETRTYSRGLSAAFDVTIATETSVGTVFRSRAEKKVAEAGYDPARLPPGQYLTEKWPVLHAGGVPETDLATWDFKVFGEVEQPITLSWHELVALPATEITMDIHCVTRWSRFDASFKGVHWRELARLVAPSRAPASRSPTPSRTSPRTCRCPRSRTFRPCSPTRRTASR